MVETGKWLWLWYETTTHRRSFQSFGIKIKPIFSSITPRYVMYLFLSTPLYTRSTLTC